MILHVDMDAFFASVEQRDNPELRGKPVIIAGPASHRGVVSTCSYEARKFGVHSAMPTGEARRLCPNGIYVEPRHHRYMEVSAQVFAIFERYTPLVQGLSCDEAFLDVSGALRLFGSAETIAKRIREDIFNELGLTASVGVAPNKLLAKIASDLQKPNGLTIVPTEPDEIASFLAPLPVSCIFGVGRVLQEKLFAHNLRKIGDLQNTPIAHLERWVGENAALFLHEYAFGRDDRPVELEREEKSISRETTFASDVSDRAVLRAALLELASDVGRQVRAAEKFASTAHLKYRTNDFHTITRQVKFTEAAQDDFSFREIASKLLDAVPQEKPVRLIGFGVSGFSTTRPPAQASLFDTPADTTRTEKREALSHTIDSIRSKLGDIIHFGK